MSPHLLIFGSFSNLPSRNAYLGSSPLLFVITNIFLLTCNKINDFNRNIPISKSQQLNMIKTCEKHLKKGPYIGSMKH